MQVWLRCMMWGVCACEVCVYKWGVWCVMDAVCVIVVCAMVCVFMGRVMCDGYDV